MAPCEYFCLFYHHQNARCLVCWKEEEGRKKKKRGRKKVKGINISEVGKSSIIGLFLLTLFVVSGGFVTFQALSNCHWLDPVSFLRFSVNFTKNFPLS